MILVTCRIYKVLQKIKQKEIENTENCFTTGAESPRKSPIILGLTCFNKKSTSMQ